MAKKSTKAKNPKPRERQERLFHPRAGASAPLVYLVGAVGSAAMGAGAWEELGASESLKAAPFILAAGALLVGVAIWMGTSSDPSLRVGDGGIAVDKGNPRRMPWYAIDNIEWRGEQVRVTGKDDAGVPMTVTASLASQPQAAAWIVKEGRSRVPSVVHVPDDTTLPLPEASAGTVLMLEPPQVVGKRCAASGKVIAYEPDARVCPRCERVYHKAHVPEACECGASLEATRTATTAS